MMLFENNLNDTEITIICNKYWINHWTLNSDGMIDVNENIHLNGCSLTKLPLKFGRVEGYFSCQYNGLTSLEGCPSYVGGDFNCYNNNIRSFEGIGHIGGNFICGANPIYVLWGYSVMNIKLICSMNEESFKMIELFFIV